MCQLHIQECFTCTLVFTTHTKGDNCENAQDPNARCPQYRCRYANDPARPTSVECAGCKGERDAMKKSGENCLRWLAKEAGERRRRRETMRVEVEMVEEEKGGEKEGGGEGEGGEKEEYDEKMGGVEAEEQDDEEDEGGYESDEDVWSDEEKEKWKGKGKESHENGGHEDKDQSPPAHQSGHGEEMEVWEEEDESDTWDI
ncbi:hypothetical protein F4808DRAFT_462606 [Astrocystis sublimbata]|nr:hypothetical protein F4808DRAFT_462606 [Astrocystis sublimbata]